MVSLKENMERVKEYFRFSKQETYGLAVAVIVMAFIFSFCGWGLSGRCNVQESLDLLLGLKRFIGVIFIVLISFLFRLSCQKFYALAQGQKAEYKVWWAGLVISLVIVFLSAGFSRGNFIIPLVFAGGVASTFLVRFRLGEFRYGFSNRVMAVTSLWGIMGNLILAIIFALLLYIYPQSYIFDKGMVFNIIMAFSALFPLPQQDGLGLFFGSRGLYYIGIAMVLLAAVLLLTKTLFGLIAAIVIGIVAGLIYTLIGSEKD